MREVIKIVGNMLARVFFLGFWGLESGAFLGFFAVVAKVLNLFFSQSVFHFLSPKASDFSHFSKSEALSHCAVGGLYGCGFN